MRSWFYVDGHCCTPVNLYNKFAFVGFQETLVKHVNEASTRKRKVSRTVGFSLITRLRSGIGLFIGNSECAEMYPTSQHTVKEVYWEARHDGYFTRGTLEPATGSTSVCN